jgi:simple sugar transport system substrate-binding protein
VIVPPTLITQDFLNEADISNMDDLSARCRSSPMPM